VPTNDKEAREDDDAEVEQFDNWFEMLQATVDRFEEENDDLEATLAGDIGFHSYFVADGDDPTRGSHTAIYQAIHETLEGVSVDADIVEAQRGEVTPETVSEEMMAQIDEFTYIPGELRDAIGEKVQERVRKNMEAGADV